MSGESNVHQQIEDRELITQLEYFDRNLSAILECIIKLKENGALKETSNFQINFTFQIKNKDNPNEFTIHDISLYKVD